MIRPIATLSRCIDSIKSYTKLDIVYLALARYTAVSYYLISLLRTYDQLHRADLIILHALKSTHDAVQSSRKHFPTVRLYDAFSKSKQPSS